MRIRPKSVRVVGANLLTSIGGPLSLDGNTMLPSVSIGFAIARSGDSVSTLLKRADLALFETKNRGRNGAFLSEDDKVPGQTL